VYAHSVMFSDACQKTVHPSWKKQLPEAVASTVEAAAGCCGGTWAHSFRRCLFFIVLIR